MQGPNTNKSLLRTPYTDEEKAEIIRLAKNGKSWDEIGAQLGRSPWGVYMKSFELFSNEPVEFPRPVPTRSPRELGRPYLTKPAAPQKRRGFSRGSLPGKLFNLIQAGANEAEIKKTLALSTHELGRLLKDLKRKGHNVELVREARIYERLKPGSICSEVLRLGESGLDRKAVRATLGISSSQLTSAVQTLRRYGRSLPPSLEVPGRSSPRVEATVREVDERETRPSETELAALRNDAATLERFAPAIEALPQVDRLLDHLVVLLKTLAMVEHQRDSGLILPGYEGFHTAVANFLETTTGIPEDRHTPQVRRLRQAAWFVALQDKLNAPKKS